MPAIPGFLGGNDVQRSLNLSDNKCVNLYPTTNDAGSITAFYSTPGLSIYSSAASVFSGIYKASNGRCFAVSGTTLYELTAGGTLTSRGTVTAGTVSKMTDNGLELIIVNGTDGWLFTFATNALTKLSSLQGTFTVTIASPAVFTSNGHGLQAGDAIQLSTTTGTVNSDGVLTTISPPTVATNANTSFVATSANGNFVYTADTTSGTIRQYVRDVTTQKLSPLSPGSVSIPRPQVLIPILGQPAAYTTAIFTGCQGMIVSPDGLYLGALCSWQVTYLTVTTVYSRSVLWFLIDSVSGKLTFNGAIPATPDNSASWSSVPTQYDGIVIDPLGGFAYISSKADNLIYQYSRSGTGGLTPLVPASVAATSCSKMVMAIDGTSLYAISATNFVYQFGKNMVSGLLSALTPATVATGTLPTDIALSSDNKSVYVTNYTDKTISQYSRNVSTFLLTSLGPVSMPLTAYPSNPQSLTITADGISVYATNPQNNSVSMFVRDGVTFLLSAPSSTTVTTGNNPYGIAATPDGKAVYVTNYTGSSISQFSRNATSTGIGLPTGLSTGTTYYVIAAGLTANNFEVSTTLAGAAVNTSGVQAGTHTFATLAAGFPNGCKTISYIDGRFVACQPNTQNFFVSDVLKGSTWQTVNVQTVDSNPDYVVGQVTLHNELIVFCEQSGEVFYDSGQYPSPFIRNVSGIFEVGCIAPYSIAKIDNSVMWLGKSNTGQGIIYRLNGYTPTRLSTYAIEFAMQTMSTITDAQAFTYQQEGHHFYVITFPTGGRTFVYDINTNLWHERQSSTITSTGISSWTNAITTATNTVFKSMAWNGSLYCAVGYGVGVTNTNLCYTSPDGLVWTARTLPASAQWIGVAWNGITFCAISRGTNAATSPDGITWTSRTIPANGTAITAGGSKFCMICQGLVSATSADNGISWLTGTLPGVGDFWRAIAWNGTVFCAVASIANTQSGATSPDGITWTSHALPGVSNWSAIAWNGSVFCALAGAAASNPILYAPTNISATSPDGITWTSRTMPATLSWSSISAMGRTFFAVANDSNNTYYSSDGISWTALAIPGGAGAWGAIANNGSTFATISQDATALSAISSAPVYTYTYGAWEAREYTYFDNKHLVTDAAEGRIYYLNLDSYTDGGVPRKWIRSFRTPPSDMKRVNHHKLWLEFEAGVGNTNAPNPQMSLKYSNDGGHTFSVDNWRDVTMGATGAYKTRIFWYRLGMTTGQPRIYELSGTAPVRVVLINAYLD